MNSKRHNLTDNLILGFAVLQLCAIGMLGCKSMPEVVAMDSQAHPQPPLFLVQHEVGPSDTLWNLVRRYNPDLSEGEELTARVKKLRALNRIGGDLVYPGQTVVVPSSMNLVRAPTSGSGGDSGEKINEGTRQLQNLTGQASTEIRHAKASEFGQLSGD